MDWVFLSKLVPLFLYPLNLAILLLCVAAICGCFRRFTAAVVTFSMAALILLISSLPVTAGALIGNLETGFPPVSAAESPEADAVLILGGALALPQPPRTGFELVNASDRIRYAWQLYKQKKAGKIIIAGGNVFPQHDVRGEAFYIAETAERMGCPAW